MIKTLNIVLAGRTASGDTNQFQGLTKLSNSIVSETFTKVEKLLLEELELPITKVDSNTMTFDETSSATNKQQKYYLRQSYKWFENVYLTVEIEVHTGLFSTSQSLAGNYTVKLFITSSVEPSSTFSLVNNNLMVINGFVRSECNYEGNTSMVGGTYTHTLNSMTISFTIISNTNIKLIGNKEIKKGPSCFIGFLNEQYLMYIAKNQSGFITLCNSNSENFYLYNLMASVGNLMFLDSTDLDNCILSDAYPATFQYSGSTQIGITMSKDKKLNGVLGVSENFVSIDGFYTIEDKTYYALFQESRSIVLVEV